MSEEQASVSVESGSQETENVNRETIPESTETQAAEQPKDDKPPGYYPVDFDGVPEDKAKAMRERYDYFYKQHKNMERKEAARERALAEYREIAAQQSRQINDLTSATGQIVDHIEARTIGETEANIKKAMKEAFEAGDTTKYVDEQARLIELQSKKTALAKKNAQPNPKTETQAQAYGGQPYDASQIANDAVSGGEITQQEAQIVDSWQSETDHSGAPLRPWAFNPTGGIPQPGSPYDIALKEMASILQNRQYAHLTMDKKLEELDRRMGTQKTSRGQTVMGGSLTTPSKTNTIRLSPEIERYAVRSKFGGPKAKSDADHIAAYRKQIETVKAKGANNGRR